MEKSRSYESTSSHINKINLTFIELANNTHLGTFWHPNTAQFVITKDTIASFTHQSSCGFTSSSCS
eukprot:TRINITY_DN4967_c0_g1_i1.p1 TRINITY_DN4967_c0_g1~~TRINITY_DN4967_c0_g1_i1.p1  ORF type:complete len:66 (+),score=2.99 TRINITY_DN4967_c0_g1_i1:334-531(+)